jgi:isoleucyl-tRNA synthetase
MEAFDVTKAARSVSDFTIDQLSNWYVRRNRRRFWKSERGKDKLAAYQTLYECITGVVKLMAPFAPFLAEELYRDLNVATQREATESVHLALMPAPVEEEIDGALEERMERAERIVMLVRAMRMKSNLKVRQPLSRLILPIAGEQEREDVRRMEDVILEEINVKAIEYVGDDSGIVRKKAKANFKSIGPKFGKSVQHVAQRIREMGDEEIARLEKEGTLSLGVNGSTVTIAREDVEILREDIQGWLVESDGMLTVALDTEITAELEAEGTAREFVNRVQNMRKDAGFAVTDHITVAVRAPEGLAATLSAMRAYIAAETLADELSMLFREGEFTATFDLNGEEVTASITRRVRN